MGLRTKTHRAITLATSFSTLVILFCCPASRAESLEVKGVVYENVVVRSTSPSHLTVSHDKGISQIALSDLPPEWQERLDYDPAVAARHQAKIAAQARQAILERKPVRPATPETPAGYTRLSLKIDFREDKPPAITRAKDQGHRPVNDIYAMVTALEYAYSMKSQVPTPLSEEFVLWALSRTSPEIKFGEGFHFTEIIRAVQIHGVCREDLFANRTDRPVTAVEEPSLAAVNDAAQRRNLQAILIQTGEQSLAQILFNLNQNRPVVVALRWPNANTFRQNATLRAQVPLEKSAHVVTLIGYQPDPSDPDAVLLLFRNSFGPHWGAAGHGFIALDYLKRHLLGAFAVDLY
ncbi:MAG: C1 family peptidase [Opitutaceae bacterium]